MNALLRRWLLAAKDRLETARRGGKESSIRAAEAALDELMEVVRLQSAEDQREAEALISEVQHA